MSKSSETSYKEETKGGNLSQPPSILEFGVDASAAASSPVPAEVNLCRCVQNLKRQQGDSAATVPQLSLGRPAVNGVDGLVGTDDPNAKESMLIRFDCTKLKDIGGVGPVSSYLSFSHLGHISDVHWMSPTAAVCASGEGHVSLVDLSPGQPMKITGSLRLHEAAIRELGLNPLNPHVAASGSFDNKLAFFDFKSGQATQAVKFEGVVGSVRWPVFNQGVCVSCTIDDGLYLVFDMRMKLEKPAFQASMGKPDLWTHERYTDHHVLMGFGDGEIQHIDMRVANKILHRTEDPYVEGIGNIQYRAADGNGAFLVTGYTDFTAWKHTYTSGQAVQWGHLYQGTNTRRNTEGFNTSGCWLGESSALISTSAGMLGLVNYDFSA